MGEKETTLKEVGEMLAHVVAHMATKDDIAQIRAEMATKADLAAFREETTNSFREIRSELADIRREIDDLRARVDNIAGYGKEIDHLMERVRAIEKHLGIERKIAA